MRKLLLFLLMSIAIGMTGCLKDDIDTIALPFSEIPKGEVPEEIKNPFNGMMPIYEGIDPPDITGKFVIKPNKLVYSSDGMVEPDEGFYDIYLSFQDQTAVGSASFSQKEGLSTTEASDISVVGSGSNFTAYIIANTDVLTYDNNQILREATSKMATVISGEATDAGIENMRYAVVLLEKYDPYNVLMDVNTYRVFKDGDGLAEKTEWSKMAIDDAKCQSHICTESLKTKKMK